MLYTPMTKMAMKIAFGAHKEQIDKSGLPYVFHPFHLAEQMDDEISVCAALLHDVAEDTEVTFDDMLRQGVKQEVIDILKLLTHDGSVPYLDYVRNIKDSGNQTAIAVKLADLTHNADVTRLETIDAKAMSRIEKYRDAIGLLI